MSLYPLMPKALALPSPALMEAANHDLRQEIQERRRAQESLEEKTRALELAQEEIVRQERLATLGQLAGGVSHELRNPLGVIRNSVYYLKMVLPEDERTRKHSIRVKKALAESLAPVMVDADHIRRLLGNLVSNAIQAMSDGGVLKVESRPLGLGLSLAKRLAESNDGRIRVVSAPGGGSCFTVELSSLQGGRG